MTNNALTLDFFTQSDTEQLINYIRTNYDPSQPLLLWLDLFCGCGGITEGFEKADKNSFVVGCVNHDPMAIKSHHANHPYCIHYTEDIRDFRVIVKLNELVKKLRAAFPNAFIGLHASLECTHFSKAKGGLARDADSRTLAHHLLHYLVIMPDYITIENVEEFLSWGPIDKAGRPIKSKKSIDYTKWVKSLEDNGYKYDYKILNAADFASYTSRKRYFGIFALNGLPISFPEPTHVTRKKLKANPELKPHKAVKDVLHLDIEGASIFGLNKNGKPYVNATFSRVYYGLIKFYKEGYFTVRYNGGNPRDKSKSLSQPLGTILTNNTHALVAPIFMSTYYGKSDNGNGIHSLEKPCPTLTTKDRVALHHLQYAHGKQIFSQMDAATATQFLQYEYTNRGKGNHSSLDVPANTITNRPKHQLVTANWLFDNQFNRIGNSINQPCPTIIARQDKKPMYLATATNNTEVDHSQWNENDSFIVMLLRTFMRQNGIRDIKIRSLQLNELLNIQGFPSTYKLHGGKVKSMKYIGNSVCPPMAQAFGSAIYKGLLKHQQKAA
tara:strand:- start:27298 stop:28956 length:1659 start_codon:yes stop_codon:yes gene_type:complete